MKRSYIILIVAILVAALVWFIERPDRLDIGDFAPFKLYPGLSSKDVDKIEVEHLLGGVVLTKSGNLWVVAELETEMGKKVKVEKEKGEGRELPRFRADSERIGQILDLMSEVETQSLVSTNPEKQSEYQVNKIGKHVKVYDNSGKVLADFFIGKRGPDYFNAYIRRDGENEVYIISQELGAMIPSDVMAWRDKKIWKVAPDLIKSVDVDWGGRKGKESFAISKNDDGVWHVIKPGKGILDTAKAEEFVNKISDISAARFAFIFDKKATGLDKPALRLAIVTTGGKTYTLLVGSENEQGYLNAKLEADSDEVYLLPSGFETKIPSDDQALMPDAE